MKYVMKGKLFIGLGDRFYQFIRLGQCPPVDLKGILKGHGIFFGIKIIDVAQDKPAVYKIYHNGATVCDA